LLGSGGRESALARSLSRSRLVSEVIGAPGNPGIAELGPTEELDPADVAAVVALARRLRPGLVVVGPEGPLVAGVGDALRAEGRRVFGPDAGAARIEGSKAYAKELMLRAGIPTAEGRLFASAPEAVAHMDRLGAPYVIKADGLAAGKGVVVTSDRAEAIDAIEARLVRGEFGNAGRAVVVEEYLDGEEASLIAFSDGRRVLACEPAQDYKRALDGDRGPNTGGMGSYSPVPSCPPDLCNLLAEEVLEPMVAATGSTEPPAPFVGALYAGLALTSRGPRVIEFNARFGDPETQALLPRLESDLGEVCVACAEGDLGALDLRWSPRVCVSVVLASSGYPGAHAAGLPIAGLGEATSRPEVDVFHAGTSSVGDEVVTAGGRVLAVSARGNGFAQARARAYDAAGVISFEGKHLRTDVALGAESAENAAAAP
jgi:phosphoribosylamine---glycine ligase